MTNTPTPSRPRRSRGPLRRVAAAAAVVAASVGAGVAGSAGGVAEAAHPTACSQLYYTTTTRVNVRSGPGTYHRVIGQNQHRNQIMCGPGIEYRTNDGSRGCSTGWWAKIRWYERTGYVCTTYAWWVD